MAAPALVRADSSGTIPRYAARAIADLSDGSVVALVANTATNNLYLYHTVDRITWTLKNTIAVENAFLYSLAVEDTGDHLQIVYGGSAFATPNTIKWVRLVKTAGPTFTPSAVETVITDGTLTIQSCDIDTIGAAACVVAYRGIDTTPNPDQEFLRVRARGTGGAWGTASTVRSVAGVGSNTIRSTDPCTISTDSAGASGGSFGFCVGAGFWGQQDVYFAHGSATVTTGALAAFVAATAYMGSMYALQGPTTGAGYATAYTDQRIQLFKSAAGEWRLLTAIRHSSSSYMWLFPFTLTWGGAALAVTSLGGRLATSAQIDYARCACVLVDGGKRLAVWVRRASKGWDCHVFNFVTGAWGPASQFSNTTMVFETALGGSQKFLVNTATVVFLDDDVDDWYGDFNQAIGVPSTITPANGSTVDTDTPTLGQKHGVPTGYSNEPTVGYWQIADNSGFSTNLKTIVEPDSEASSVYALYSSYEIVPVASQLTQGLKYLRAATMDLFGKLSAFSATQSFTVSHPPTAIPSDPSSGKVVDFGAGGDESFNWLFSDTSPVDFQTAFQVIVERNSDGLGILNSGKIVSAAVAWVGTIPAIYKDVLLRWKVSVWDSDDVNGPYSDYATFTAMDAPTVAVTSPTAAQVLDNPAPTFTWSFAASNGRTQVQKRLVIVDVTGTPFQVYDSGIVLGVGTSLAPSGPVLLTGRSYQVQVTVTDSVGLSKTATQNFSVVLVVPATPVATVDINGYDSLGYALVSWTNAQEDAAFVAYRVYRKLHSDTVWTLLYETHVVGAAYTYHDWMAASGYSYDWAVVQVANRYGVEVESVYSPLGPYTPVSSDYWLIHPDDETLNTRIAIVKSDDFHLETEKNDMKLIDRGFKSDYGTTWGHRGTLAAEVWDRTDMTARAFRLRMEQLQEEQRELWMRNPFGDIWLITMADAEIGRVQGVGNREFHTMSLPYVEVS